MSLRFFRELDQYRALLDAVSRDPSALEVGGIIDPAKPLFLAQLMRDLRIPGGGGAKGRFSEHRPLVFIRLSTSPLTGFADEVRFFWEELAKENPSARPGPASVAVLPALSENPYLEVPHSLEAVSSRMHYFRRLLHRSPALTVTTAAGLLKPIPGTASLAKAFLRLDVDTPLERDRLLRWLRMSGYTRQDLVNAHGEFAWRGGIVDVYSPWEELPFRIELGAERVASLRTFDPSSQRSLTRTDGIEIPALQEFPGSDKFMAEWENLARLKARSGGWDDLAAKIERLKDGDVFPSFSYLALLDGERFQSPLALLEDPLFIIDGWDGVRQDWEETLKDWEEQAEEIRSQKRFTLPPSEIFCADVWRSVEGKAVRLIDLGLESGGEFLRVAKGSPSGDEKEPSPSTAPSPGGKRVRKKKSGPAPAEEGRIIRFPFQSVPRFENRVPFFLKYLKRLWEEREICVLYFAGEGVRRKLAALLDQEEIPYLLTDDPFTLSKEGAPSLLLGDLRRGFVCPPARVTLLAEGDIFTEERVLVRRSRAKPFTSHFQDLNAGDYVVHTDYGIGLFSGLLKMKVDGRELEFMDLRYRDDDKLFVPVEDLNLVQKYAKVGTTTPVLNKLGTPQWERTKARTKKAIEAIAKELLELYAQRKAVPGHSYSSGDWEEEFAKTFEYEETEDQLLAIKEITRDMENPSPMDRLLCGDVGYGKTEVAIRAAFKTVMDGKQVAVLCPTTVLASQHLKTFRGRMILFPLRVESLTRFQRGSEQKRILEDVKKGLVDILVGTHRLLSGDVMFKDLGLLIVDEEQRFGVSHKEKIKSMKTDVDVLTLTATPIPRTLNLSLTGLRDISLIETPPKDRLAIHTVITPFSRKLITDAVKKELSRGGQVYFVHNRVEDIDSFAQRIENWVPQANVVVIHGQMTGPMLEERMIAFIRREYNVLVSTTIIENGIDIPLVNTLIVNSADRFGLAQLYQLRGRVGRSSRQAVAYFLVPPYSQLTPQARMRLKALQEFSALGSGFRLAAKDLEIRGAGSFLGARQAGHIEAVGFDYYMELLERTVRELKGEKPPEVKTEINLRVNIRISEDYLPQINLRLNLYKRISSAESLAELEGIRNEIKDRYGPMPPGLKNLLRYGVVKLLANRLSIKRIDRVGRRLVFDFYPGSDASADKLPQLLKKYRGSLTPQGVMSLTLASEGEAAVLDETIFILKELTDI
jgi:transcription-repair coupling factor (superfamily II helicase)